MSQIKVLVLAFPWNPTCRNWVYGLKSLGYQVALLVWNATPLTSPQLEEWGFAPNDIPIFQMTKTLTEGTISSIIQSLNGVPDIIYSWEGALIFKPLRFVQQAFSQAKTIHCANTFPNAINEIAEQRLYWRYRQVDPGISGYIFYSTSMQQLCHEKIPTTQGKPSLIMVEPFLKEAFATDVPVSTTPILKRLDSYPHVIFTGRGTELWKRFSLKERRDALGKYFQQLAARDIHVFVSPRADTRGLPNLHHYPHFSNEDIYRGRFSAYVSQFDAHLVMYNEYNNTVRRWAASGLSTRFSSALTAICPIAVTTTSQFAHELWRDCPFGFMFKNIDNLAATLHDHAQLQQLRDNMKQVHQSFSFESQSTRVAEFFEAVAQERSTSVTVSLAKS